MATLSSIWFSIVRAICTYTPVSKSPPREVWRYMNVRVRTLPRKKFLFIWSFPLSLFFSFSKNIKFRSGNTCEAIPIKFISSRWRPYNDGLQLRELLKENRFWNCWFLHPQRGFRKKRPKYLVVKYSAWCALMATLWNLSLFIVELVKAFIKTRVKF